MIQRDRQWLMRCSNWASGCARQEATDKRRQDQNSGNIWPNCVASIVNTIELLCNLWPILFQQIFAVKHNLQHETSVMLCCVRALCARYVRAVRGLCVSSVGRFDPGSKVAWGRFEDSFKMPLVSTSCQRMQSEAISAEESHPMPDTNRCLDIFYVSTVLFQSHDTSLKL